MEEFKLLEGTWHIYEMELWDGDYFNMEVQAFIEIASKGTGKFQFGLVRGALDTDEIGGDRRMKFTWSGSDENGDKSKFWAKRR